LQKGDAGPSDFEVFVIGGLRSKVSSAVCGSSSAFSH
jgi:hypothetical protein